MSLKLNERYPGRFENPSADYPQGAFKNRTAPDAKDGSYLEKDWANDKEGFFQSLLEVAGVEANGNVDKVGSSQFFDSLLQLDQNQVGVAFTTAGTSTALTLTPTPAIQGYASSQRFSVKFSISSGLNPTLNVSGKGAKSLKQYDATGAKVSATFAADQVADVVYDGVDFVMLGQLPPTVKMNAIQSVQASLAANALTATISATSMDFRSPTLSSGAVNGRNIPAAISIIVPSGATLGTTNGVASRLVLLAIDNAGTVEPAIVNLAGGVNLDETTLINTTAISAGATAANVIYSTTARTGVPFRVVGIIGSTQASAGAWATPLTLVQGVGGQAVAGMSSIGYGQTPLDVSGSRAFSTNYPNTTGKPKLVSIQAAITGAVSTAHVIINVAGVPFRGSDAANGARSFATAIVPPGMVCSANLNTGSSTQTFWMELG